MTGVGIDPIIRLRISSPYHAVMYVRLAGRGKRAGIAQLVEYKLPKLGVAGSNPVARSIFRPFRPASLFEVVSPVQGK